MIKVRKATLDDKKDFSNLILISAPYFQILFSRKIQSVLQDLFCRHSNLFSFEHVYFAEVDKKKAGMLLGYDWQTKKQENLKTGFLLFKRIGVGIIGRLPLLMKFNATVGKLYKGEYYISNIATYPKYRGMGVGKRLMFEVEQDAKIMGTKRIVLDVEKNNIGAIDFYKKLGYEITKEFSVPLQRNKILQFYRMTKELK